MSMPLAGFMPAGWTAGVGTMKVSNWLRWSVLAILMPFQNAEADMVELDLDE